MWGNRPLVEVETRDGAMVTATREHLHISAPETTLPWHTVITAEWDAPILRIHAAPEGSPCRFNLEIPNPKRLPEVVRERVTDSVIISERRTLPGGASATFVARRLPGDEVAWSVVFDSGLNAQDPELQAQASRLLEDLRSTLGV